MRKVLSLICSFLLMFGVCTIGVSAAEISNFQTNPAVYTIDGAKVSAFIKEKITNTGVNLTNNSVVQLVPLSSVQKANNGSALVITNISGVTVTKDVLVLVSDEGVGFRQNDTAITRGSGTAEFPPLSWDGRYVVRGTAVYNQYSDGFYSSFYQPVGVYFTYQTYTSCNVSNVKLTYICDGFEHTYPGFQDLGLPEISYTIAVEKASPVQSVMYSTTKAYNTSRVIFTGSGSPLVGQFLTFDTVVDGVSAGYTVTI